MKILIVEDHTLLGKSLKRGMEENGWIVDLCIDGDEGLHFASSCAYDIVILDWLLPKRSGIELLGTLRKLGNKVPTIIITAKGAVAERVNGLNNGADDYIVKPFELVELIARVNAVYRRSLGSGTSTLEIGALTLDIATQSVKLFGQTLDLTGKEYDLLAALVARPGTLLRRQDLVGILYELDDEPDSNSLDVLLARIRKKLAGSGVEIATVRGKGFVLRVAEASP